MPVSYALMSVVSRARKTGATLGLTRSSAFVRQGKEMAKVSMSGKRITVTVRDKDVYRRRIITLLDPGLAVSSSTSRKGGEQQLSNHVIWKNAQAFVSAPLSHSKLARLKQQLDGQQRGVGAIWRKIVVRERARPASELKRALRAIGVQGSVDWR